MKITITQEQVNAAYCEIDRRVDIAIRDRYYETIADIRNGRNEMLQGLYSVFMSISANWPDVVRMCDKEEEKRGYGYWQDLYPIDTPSDDN